jgi:hypothetical protein
MDIRVRPSMNDERNVHPAWLHSAKNLQRCLCHKHPEKPPLGDRPMFPEQMPELRTIRHEKSIERGVL